MHILVTGATGFLGSRLVERLITLPEVDRITATGRTLKRQATHHHGKLTYQLGDLAEANFVASLFKDPPTAVVNCASLSSPWGALEEFMRANVQSQRHLISHAEEAGVDRYVYVSTPSLYVTGKGRQNIRESEPLPQQFANHYALTKRLAEELLHASKLCFVTLRPRALVGRGDTVIMPRIIRSYNEGRLKRIGDGNPIVDLTGVTNVVESIWLSLKAPEAACSTEYNITGGDSVPLWEALSYVLNALGYVPPTKRVPYRLAYTVASLLEWKARTFGGKEPVFTRYTIGTLAHDMTLNIDKAKKHLNYHPIQSTYEAIDEFIAWHQQNTHEAR